MRQIAENLFRFPEGHDLGGLNLDDEIEIEGGVFRVVGVSALTGNIIMQSASGARIEIQAGSDFPIDSMPQQ